MSVSACDAERSRQAAEEESYPQYGGENLEEEGPEAPFVPSAMRRPRVHLTALLDYRRLQAICVPFVLLSLLIGLACVPAWWVSFASHRGDASRHVAPLRATSSISAVQCEGSAVTLPLRTGDGQTWKCGGGTWGGGLCIHQSEVCDGFANCIDESDEDAARCKGKSTGKGGIPLSILRGIAKNAEHHNDNPEHHGDPAEAHVEHRNGNIEADDCPEIPESGRTVCSLLDNAAASGSQARGTLGTNERNEMASLFWGTNVSDSGNVALSRGARTLVTAMAAKGFKYMTLYHGTKSEVLPYILGHGFLVSTTGWHGIGVYTTETLSHAQCYSQGSGAPILKLHVYYDPGDEKRYVKHVPHNSVQNDVWLVTDPLTIIVDEVIKCCPEDFTCM